MTHLERRLYMLMQIQTWADLYTEGIERGELSDNLYEDWKSGIINSEKDAKEIQKMFAKEVDRMSRKNLKLKLKINPDYDPIKEYEKFKANFIKNK